MHRRCPQEPRGVTNCLKKAHQETNAVRKHVFRLRGNWSAATGSSDQKPRVYPDPLQIFWARFIEALQIRKRPFRTSESRIAAVDHEAFGGMIG